MDINITTILSAAILLALIILMLLARRKANESQNTNPLATAEVYLAYGRKKEAKELLEKFLLKNPGDAQATSLLNRANK